MPTKSLGLLWQPDEDRKRRANITSFADSYFGPGGRGEVAYQELWNWSVENLDQFWGAIWRSSGLPTSSGNSGALQEKKMPGARWFRGTKLNYAEVALRTADSSKPAIVYGTERGGFSEVAWGELRRLVATVAASLRSLGVGIGDRVAAYVSNVPESVVAFLATASLGAVWSSCSPDFGAPSVRDRFSQIGPKVLIASTGYEYGGRYFDRSDAVKDIVASMPSLKAVVYLPNPRKPDESPRGVRWEDLLDRKGESEFEQVPFDHPLWVLYSSGTTGLPKPIVHGHGGIVLEHLKALSLHNDLGTGDRFFWYTTTGWMMWNYLVGGLLVGATIVLYEGSPSFPDSNALWSLAEKAGVEFLGTSAAHIGSCMKAGVDPSSTHRLAGLTGVGSTGSSLSPEAFRWTYSHVKEDLWLASISGGTDVCTAFVGGCPILPVYAGEIQCRCLGAKVEAFSEVGKSVVGRVGELVITEPMPSMPLFFWGDSDGHRYRESYFDSFPGVWRHGDWVEITDRGTCIIYGRSDATIKRMGVRIGTSEIYRAVESMPEITDAVAVDVEVPARGSEMLLFVSTAGGRTLDDDLVAKIRSKLRTDVSPRYVPDMVMQVPSIPRTINGKKVEVPLKKILMGADPAKAVNFGALSDPASLDFFVALAGQMKVARKA